MENITEIFNYIGRTNLFNFIIFLSIFILIFRKIKLGEKLDATKQAVIEEIETSTVKKIESEDNLTNIEKSLANIGNEIDEILRKSEENAQNIGNKILESAEQSAKMIQENANKVIENSQNLLKNELIKRASLASIEIARTHIIDELNRNYDLHEKLIDESINALEGVELQ